MSLLQNSRDLPNRCRVVRLAAASLIAAAPFLHGCSAHTKEAAAEPAGEKPAESRVTHGTNGEIVIRLDVETQKLMGLQTAALVPATLRPELKAYGHVLDLSPLGPLLNELATAQMAADSSHKELDRTKVLREQNNASDRALQTAETAYLRDAQAVRALRVKAEGVWGKKLTELIASSTAAAEPSNQQHSITRRLLERDTLLARVDLPPDAGPAPAPGAARLVPLSENSNPIPAEFFDFALTVEPTTQAQGLLYVFENPEHQLAPGMALTAFIAKSEQEQSGVLVPRAALIRTEGQAWIYLQTGPKEFTRKAITLDQPLETGWFVSPGPAVGDKVVTAGAQQMLSEELKGQGE